MLFPAKRAGKERGRNEVTSNTGIETVILNKDKR